MTQTDAPLDFRDPAIVAAYDDLSIWSSFAGTLLLDHVPMGPYARVLDVGCGTGFPLTELAGRFGPTCKVTGIDTWTEAIDRAQQKIETWGLTNATAEVADAAAMTFEDDTFDLVVSNLGINNFSDPTAVTKECARVLKPRRPLVMTTNLRGHMEMFYDALRRSLEDLNQTEGLARLEDHMSTRMSQDEVTDLLERTGFSIESVERKTTVLRYSSWDAFWTHPFVRLAFKDPWLDIAEDTSGVRLIALLKEYVEESIAEEGELRLSVPLAYVEARAL